MTVEPVNKARLEALYTSYKDADPDRDTGVDWTIFSAALETAGNMLKDNAVTQMAVNRAAQALADAAEG